MPSSSFYAGGQLLPRAAAGTNSQWRDATLDGLLAYFAFWLRTTLSAKAAEMGGPVSSAAITDACPAANLFPFNHNGTFMRPLAGASAAPLPGLWLWEESAEATKEGATLFHPVVLVRTLRLNWIFPEVQVPDGIAARSGIVSDALSTIAKACDEGFHPSYAPTGHPAGTAMHTALSLLGFSFVRGQYGAMAPKPNGASVRDGRASDEGVAQRHFPALDATIRVHERIGNWEAVVPDDTLGDSTLTIEHGDSTADTIEILERVLTAPDDLADP